MGARSDWNYDSRLRVRMTKTKIPAEKLRRGRVVTASEAMTVSYPPSLAISASEISKLA